jgi:hypothetical protein
MTIIIDLNPNTMIINSIVPDDILGKNLSEEKYQSFAQIVECQLTVENFVLIVVRNYIKYSPPKCPPFYYLLNNKIFRYLQK